MFSKAFHPDTTEWLCYFFINSDSQMCVVETIPEGGRTAHTQKKGCEKKLCLVSSEPVVLVLSMKVAKRKLLRPCVILRAIKGFIQ